MRALRTAVLILFFATPSFAGYVRIVPAAPHSNDAIVVDLVGTSGDSCVPRNPQLSRVGNQIDILLTIPTGLCLLAPTSWEERVPIGSLPPGVFTLQVRVDSPSFKPPIVWHPSDRLSFAVTRANPEFTFTPNVGATAGGAEVFVAGSFGSCVEPACFTPQVFFGGIRAATVREAWGGVIATTPAHTAGAVDVEVRGRAGTTLATLPVAFTFAAPGLPSPAAYTPVLLPVIFSGPGDRGSMWVTEASAYNRSHIAITPLNREAVTTCPPNVSPCPAPAFAPHAWDDFHHGANYPGGLILWIPRNQADDLHFALHARDSSRTTENIGSEILVVREDELLREVHLLNVPVRPGFRQTLRVYDIAAGGTSCVGVHFYSKTNEYLGFRGLLLSSPDASCFDPNSHCTPSRPRYGEISDFPPRNLPASIDSVRISISTLDPGARLWAFVSVTNNVTQQITTVTPQ
jgi:hypothetical protein